MTTNRSRRPPAVLAVVVAVGLFYAGTLREGHEWGDDHSAYIHHAKNIVDGVAYGDINYIYNSHLPILGPKTYPPVFPFLLAPSYQWFGLNLTAFKVVGILMSLVSLWAMFLVFKDHMPSRYVIPVVALAGFHPYFWELKDAIISDVPFLFFTYVTLYFITRAYDANPPGQIPSWQGVLIGFLIYLAYGTRSIGIVLLPCLVLYDLIESQRLTRFAAVAVAVSACLIFAQTGYFHSDSAYADQLANDLHGMRANLSAYAISMAEYWQNGYFALPRRALFVLLSGLALGGYLSKVRERFTILDVFTPLYLVVVLIPAINGGMRFLLPVFPAFLFYAFRGLFACAGWIERGQPVRERAYVFGLTTAIAIAYVGQYSRQEYHQIHEGVTKTEAVELFDYIRNHTDANDVFLFRRPRALALFTGRRASVCHITQRDEDLWDYFREIDATYFITGPSKHIEPEYQEFYRSFVARYRRNFEEVYSNPDFEVYRIHREPVS